MEETGFPAIWLHDKRLVTLELYNDGVALLDALNTVLCSFELTRRERRALRKAADRMYQWRHYRDQQCAMWTDVFNN